MLIGCDAFNKKLLATTSLQLNVEENFGVCDRIYDVIITNWKQICSYIKLHKNKLQSTLFVLSQFSDGSHNRQIAITVQQFNKMYGTNNSIVIIGDGWSHFNNNIHSPWSRFLWNDRDMLTLDKPTTHWTCLMSRRRPHRDNIEKFLLDNTELFNYPNYFVYDESQNADTLQKYMFRKTLSKHNYYKNDPTWIIDKTKHNMDRYNVHTDGDLIFPYHKTKIELVAETVTDYFFITEKTTKPIRAGIPFVIVGGHHFLKRLRKMGFKTFSPLIDESYDNEIDDEKRIQMCCVAFKEFYLNTNIDNNDIWHICAHNQQVLKRIQDKLPQWENRLARKIAYQVNQYAKKQSLPTAKYTDGP